MVDSGADGAGGLLYFEEASHRIDKCLHFSYTSRLRGRKPSESADMEESRSKFTERLLTDP